MGNGDDKMYFPCARMVKEAFTEDDMSLGARLFLGTIGLVGTIVYDPVDAVFTALDLDRGDHQDPEDIANM